MKLNPKNIALFGTSADPPTIGHKKIIKELSKVFSLVITYASDNPSKTHKENLSFRSLLLDFLIKDLNTPNVLFDQAMSSPWAIRSIEKCKLKYNTKKVTFVIGSDLIDQIVLWKNFYELVKESSLYIIPRESHPLNKRNLESIKLNGGNYKIASFKIPNISSSMVRESNLSAFLPESLIEIIKDKNLYQNLE